MKKPNPIAIVVLCVVAVSVLAFTINDGLKNRTRTSSGSSSPTTQNPISSSPFIAYNPPHGKPGHRHDLPDGAPLPGVVPNQSIPTNNNLPLSNNQVAQPAATTDAVALNPAHGQPGHRCEIAVGAPLNSAASPINTTSGITSATTAPVSGTNPEHGKPGHRCDIAVGAPLNSAPASTSSPAAVSTTTASAPKTAPGMNPAHGQPGHRCDIAVGAPLNSAPTTSATTTSATTNTSNPQLFPNYNFPTTKESAVITPVIKSDSASGSSTPAQ